jgi:hypothetical protein
MRQLGTPRGSIAYLDPDVHQATRGTKRSGAIGITAVAVLGELVGADVALRVTGGCRGPSFLSVGVSCDTNHVLNAEYRQASDSPELEEGR